MSSLGPLNHLPVSLLGIKVATALLLVYAICKSIYNAFFHPLAKVPGPKLMAFSNVPYLYHVSRGSWVRKLKDLHDQYGPIVRYTQNDVSCIAPSAWKEIYGHKNDATNNFPKDTRFYGSAPGASPQIVIANDVDHKRMRRLMAHAFSEKALRSQEDIVKQYVDVLIAKLDERSRAGQEIDIVSWYNFTTFDLIGDLAFGEPFGCLESGGYHPWVAMIFDNIKMVSFMQIFQRLPWTELLAPFVIPQKTVRSMQEHGKLSEATARKRIESGNTQREDFMSYMLRNNDKDSGMSERELIMNSEILITAGSETTATLLSGVTFQLLTNHAAYEKLVREVRSSFAAEEDITIGNVAKLEYLGAVIDEGFRLYPPVPVGLPRVVPAGGHALEGYYLPAGTIVSVPQVPAYQYEQNWNQPQDFIPERWLGDERFASDKRDVLNPFSVGPRNCIGKNLAWAEIRMILVRLVWAFDLELVPGGDDWDKQDVHFIWQKGALNVKLTPVKKSAHVA